jgi:hypothetical protein
MNIQEVQEFAKTLEKGSSQYFRRTDIADGRTRGLTIEKTSEGLIWVRPNRSKRRLYRYGFAGLTGRYEAVVPRPRDPARDWRRRWTRVMNECRAWGLWPEYADEIERGLDIGYEKVRAAHDAYWADPPGKSYEEKQKIGTDAVGAIDSRLMKDGSPDTGVIWKMHEPPRIARMNVGTYTEELAQAIRAAEKGYRTPQVLVGNRENSAEISDKDAAHAWYSREYVGCGNGSYYLIISPTHAVFCEDD